MRSIIIAKRIEASLDHQSLKSLMLEKRQFQWRDVTGTTNNDGPTMLYLILSKINPSVRVGISTLKTNLASATLPKFRHDVAELLDYMKLQFNQIIQDGGSHNDYTLNLYTALLTSNNDEFLKFVSILKDDWECDTGNDPDQVTADFLREKALTKYNNMLQSGRWKRTEDASSKIISALATEVQNLKQKLAETNTNQALATTEIKKPKLMIPQWRTENKGNKVVRDNKTWWWCPHHKKEGLFNGLYMPHKPEDHHKWAQEKKQLLNNKKNNSNSGNNQKMQLSEAMKQALVTEGNMSDEQATAL